MNTAKITLIFEPQVPLLSMIKKYFRACWLPVTLVLMGLAGTIRAQDTTARTPNYRARMRTLLIGESVLYVGSLYGLSTAWYTDPLTQFKFFDDVGEWKQIDKIGHVYTAYHIARMSAQGYRWAGQSPRKAAWYGALTGFIFQTPIEILDGFAPGYGFSVGDVVANTLGSALYAGQFGLWGEERILPKFSFHQTRYAAVRPNLLGKGLSEEWLKDYNGQTYWFSANVASFLPRRDESRFPRWLNVAVGYGVENMVAAYPNSSVERGYVPYRQYFLSLDVDFARIRSNRKLVRTLLFLANSVKIPAPALELSRKGVKFHPLYF
ncbi:DUF2279 domain-containing protein [Fibrisoma limi]|nr:DUF2279 domain-containing protein [Fibrisoma limi]